MAKSRNVSDEQKPEVEQQVEQQPDQKPADYDSLPAEARKKLEEEALRRVCKASGISPEELASKEELAKKREQDDPMVEVNLGSQIIRVNGTRYSGKFRCRRSEAEQIQFMAGARRMRLIREKVGNKYEVSLLAGGVTARCLGPADGSNQ